LRRGAILQRVAPAARSPFPYTPEALRERVLALYRRQCGRPRPPVPPARLGRADCLFLLTQLAPAALVDGAWLEQIARPCSVASRAVQPLFQIYMDEQGDGVPEQHHPSIYRRLLTGLDIQLPPVTDPAFAQAPSLTDAAFEIPLLWLSFAAFPKGLFPECLGLNLAIELSGLGQGYLILADELKAHGIDPYFFLLHLTIDNPATGHTALALAAIDDYLAERAAIGGDAAVQAEFVRIWRGFLAFRATVWATGAALAWSLGPRKLAAMRWPWLRPAAQEIDQRTQPTRHPGGPKVG
jgi:hypothetical protein